ncbi:cytochrome c4 [Suttonella sp. R2A3]|uniref:c-type cytochrome n=1 Tax=Suttonella sp. R2A3 TaxID=2908648 RepID=UPI001F161DF7|nr:c-type cytochrome [Suttonella sp. R2A3]UJF24877.1 cytochrome c4 [Suttonella sp. R2A3]
MKLSLAMSCLGMSVFSLNALALEGNAEEGHKSAIVCSACHHEDGSGQNIPGGESWPKLAGMNAEYLYKQLQDFKEGARENPTMAAIVLPLSDEQMKNLAVYYSELPKLPGQGGEEASEEQLALGQKLAERGNWDKYIVSCQSCHGPDNQGAGTHFPAIAGQHAGYIEQELKAFQEGVRYNDPQNLMSTIAKRMNDEEIHAVALWLSTQNSH